MTKKPLLMKLLSNKVEYNSFTEPSSSSRQTESNREISFYEV